MKKQKISNLEKKGEKPCNVSPIDDFQTEFEKQVSYLIASSINKENDYTADYVKWIANALLNYAKKELEKQGANSASVTKGNTSVTNAEVVSHLTVTDSNVGKCTTASTTIKPKFKIGDWIVNNNSGYVYQVTEIRDDEYCLWPLDTEIEGYVRIIDVDNDYHLWIIEEANDGDVIADKYNNIGIFQECRGICWYSYIYLGCDGELRGFDIGGSHGLTDTHPATKEQRNFLFAKMKEEGYGWDADKKKVKIIDFSKHLKYEPNAPSIIEESAWSEEDEDMIQALNACIDASIKGGMNYISFDSKSILIGKVKSWLKSFTKMVKMEKVSFIWSEEDERIRQCLIRDQEEALDNVCNDKYGHSEIISDLKEMYRERIKWLESLKCRM